MLVQLGIPRGKYLQGEVQTRAAKFESGNYSFENGGMANILKQLKWETFKERRRSCRLKLFYKGIKGKGISIPTDELKSPLRRFRNQHPLRFQLPILGLLFISIVSSLKHSEIGMRSVCLLYPQQMVWGIACLDSHHY